VGGDHVAGHFFGWLTKGDKAEKLIIEESKKKLAW
jgi:hypothetical protein